MIINRKIHSTGTFLFILLLLCLFWHTANSQDSENRNGISKSWLTLQAIPSISWTNFPASTKFAFEWEVTPVLYSFGMNKLDRRCHFFFVTQPERFAGSIEFNLSTQLYPSKVVKGHWGFSGQLLIHLPIVERGEYLGLNIGTARYTIDGFSSNYLIAGFSTIFGFLHYNIKYSPSDEIWMHSIEFRFF